VIHTLRIFPGVAVTDQDYSRVDCILVGMAPYLSVLLTVQVSWRQKNRDRYSHRLYSQYSEETG
jgi:hypothetical protein